MLFGFLEQAIEHLRRLLDEVVAPDYRVGVKPVLLDELFFARNLGYGFRQTGKTTTEFQ
ncbi:hypothetical protein NKI04_26365 [Mesorhizobium sp. M0814]|uniref:hypothetical protein n=1 Tax=Mesorhizobium sp. M0814 TaxID=2957004 RepID=UPI00333651D3